MAQGLVLGAARVRLGADRTFKGATGVLVRGLDGTVRFEPSEYDLTRGAVERMWRNGDAPLRWLGETKREWLSGASYRRLEVRDGERREVWAAFAFAGDLAIPGPA